LPVIKSTREKAQLLPFFPSSMLVKLKFTSFLPKTATANTYTEFEGRMWKCGLLYFDITVTIVRCLKK